MTTDYGKAQVLFGSNEWNTISAGSTGDFSLDANEREGIYYTNTQAGNAMELMVFDGSQETITVNELATVFYEAYVDNFANDNNVPLIQVYTKPTGSGDIDPAYHSKRTYAFDNTKTWEIGVGELCCYYAINPPLNTFEITARNIALPFITTMGSYYGKEEILKITISSNPSANAGDVKVDMTHLGFHSNLGNARLMVLMGVNPVSGIYATKELQQQQLTAIQSLSGYVITSGTLFDQTLNTGTTYTSTVIDTKNYQFATIMGSHAGSSSNTIIRVETSTNNTDFYLIDTFTPIHDPTNGMTYYSFLRSQARYLRVVIPCLDTAAFKLFYSLK